jgi:hypothetical protein
MKKVIVWEKWRDPFTGDDEDEIKLDPEFIADESESFDDQPYDNSIESQIKNNAHKKVRVIATPMGLIPYNEYTASSKIFNFWVGHTNFDITYKVANLIEHVPGVETLDVFSRYRFRISIGKAFEDRVVMNSIDTHLCNNERR